MLMWNPVIWCPTPASIQGKNVYTSQSTATLQESEEMWWGNKTCAYVKLYLLNVIRELFILEGRLENK